jgi:hypothetical protein
MHIRVTTIEMEAEIYATNLDNKPSPWTRNVVFSSL